MSFGDIFDLDLKVDLVEAAGTRIDFFSKVYLRFTKEGTVSWKCQGLTSGKYKINEKEIECTFKEEDEDSEDEVEDWAEDFNALLQNILAKAKYEVLKSNSSNNMTIVFHGLLKNSKVVLLYDEHDQE